MSIPICIPNERDKKVHLYFKDSKFKRGKVKNHYERTIVVDGREFCVCSFYDAEPKSTPIEKLLKLIDLKAEKS